MYGDTLTYPCRLSTQTHTLIKHNNSSPFLLSVSTLFSYVKILVGIQIGISATQNQTENTNDAWLYYCSI